MLAEKGDSMNQNIFPKRIILTEGNVDNAQALIEEKSLQIGLKEPNLCVLKGKSSVILDFGKELAGGVRILTLAVSGNNQVRLRFGESISETSAEIGEKNAGNDHSNRDFKVKLQYFSDMAFGQTGFRFLRIDTLDDNSIIKLKAVVAKTEIDERLEIGSFVCDDELVNNIWETAAYTLRLCLQNGYFWDGVKRDRLVWIGDLYPEMRAAHCLYGIVPETVNCLEFSLYELENHEWLASLPSYCLWWIIVLRDEYQASGDKKILVKFLPYVKMILDRVKKCVNDDGSTSYPRNFIDWQTNYTEGDLLDKKTDSAIGMEYLTQIALQKAKEILSILEIDFSICDNLLTILAKRNERKVSKYKQISALGVLSGDKSENNKDILLNGGAKGMSTFMSYPILTALAEFGEEKKALSMLKDYYGGMLSVGATTFWEDFDIEWLKNSGRIDAITPCDKKDIHGDFGAFCYKGFRHSLCHGWSAGVIPYLIETIVGVKIVDAGMRNIKILPKLSGLKKVDAIIPSPYGEIKVSHEVDAAGKTITKLEKPKEIEII